MSGTLLLSSGLMRPCCLRLQWPPVGPQYPSQSPSPRSSSPRIARWWPLLAAAERPPDSALQQHYLYAARRTAAFLLQSGLWDDTFGGGFWWNTNRGDTAEGKPAQSNALAAQFFAQLYQ